MTIVPTVVVSSVLGGNALSDEHGPASFMAGVDVQHQLAQHGLRLKPVLEIKSAHVNVDVDKHQAIKSVIKQCRSAINSLRPLQKPFLFLGGDHSAAMGIWSQCRKILPADKRFILLWIDAHMDAHHCLNSDSGNVHGMPVQGLLGTDDKFLAAIFDDDVHLKSNEIILLGVRSFEACEQVFLNRRQVKVLYAKDMPDAVNIDVDKQPLIKNLITLLDSCDFFAISLDLDVIDPVAMPAVSCREKGGVTEGFILALLSDLTRDKRFIGAEIAEYAACNDSELKGEKLLIKIIQSLYA